MKRQRGQTLIEFALMAPMMFLLIFSMIYGGVMFVEYMNFNNEARTLARQISVADEDTREELLEEYKWDGTAETQKFARFYDVTMRAKAENGDATVVVEFKRDNKDLPWIVYKVGFPPEEFAIRYNMTLEKE